MPSNLVVPLLGGLIALTVVLAVIVAYRPNVTRGTAGKILAFLALCALPVGAVWAGLSLHMESSKSTQFCLSCHNMEPYGTSLLFDDTDYLPAGHFQNRRVDREHACFTCHTTYTMFGDYKAKLAGLKHVWVYYLGDPPEAGEIELYQPYRNRECLWCHAGARSFTETHEDDLEDLRTDELSCLECHEWVHDAGNVHDHDLWATSVAETLEPNTHGGPDA